MHGFKALIFDVDGTVADTERDGHRPAFNAAFADVGLDWHWDQARYGELLRVTGGKERIRYFMDLEGLKAPEGRDLDELVADLHRRKTAHYLSLLRTGSIPLRPGILRLWREARDAGIRLAIATTTTPENVTELLNHAGVPGLLSWLDVIAAGDVVPSKKPAPDIYHFAMERMGLEARDCIAFEDSDNGARSALDAGIRTLVVTTNDYTAEQDFPGVPLVLDQLGEPQSPPKVVNGSLGGSPCVDLAALERLHGEVQLRRPEAGA